MPARPLPWWALASVLLCAAAAGWGCWERIRAERGNRAVGLALEAEEIRDRAALEGASYGEALVRLKQAGLTGVSVSEELGAAALEDGRITVSVRGEAVMLSGPQEAVDRLCRGLGRRNAALACRTRSLAGGRAVAETAAPLSVLQSASMGLPPVLAEGAREAGLEVIARFGVIEGEDGGALQARLTDADVLGARWLLASGEAVPGFKSQAAALAEIVKRLDWRYLDAEFAKTFGSSSTLARIPERSLRLHAASAAELAKMNPSAAVERFARAQRERGMRWLLLRSFEGDSGEPLAALGRTVASTAQGVSAQEGVPGVPRPFEPPAAPFWLPALIGALAAPALAWLAFSWASGRLAWAMAAAGAASPLLLAWPPQAGLGALAIACGFPLLGYSWLIGRASAPRAILAFPVMCGFALAGGMAVAGSLTGLPYALQVELFPGVKASLYLTLAAAVAVMAHRAMPLRAMLAKPIYWGAALLAMAALGMIALLLIRTGNDNPAAVSSLELQFRSILDQVLYVRPRTKEFLIGHPALVVGLVLWRRGPGLGAALLVGLGMIGLAGMVNTFCHLHSPVHLAFARSVIGMAAGGILGSVLALAALRLLERKGG